MTAPLQRQLFSFMNCYGVVSLLGRFCQNARIFEHSRCQLFQLLHHYTRRRDRGEATRIKAVAGRWTRTLLELLVKPRLEMDQERSMVLRLRDFPGCVRQSHIKISLLERKARTSHHVQAKPATSTLQDHINIEKSGSSNEYCDEPLL
jgi:hypothetical protein